MYMDSRGADDLLAVEPESSGLLELFASEECFNLIFLEFALATGSFATEYLISRRSDQPSPAHLSAESLLSICQILSNAMESVEKAAVRAPIGRLEHEQDPNPNILPCILRHLQPWRLRHLPAEAETRKQILGDSLRSSQDIRDLVELSTRLSDLVNRPNPDFHEPVNASPRKMRIRWLGRSRMYELKIPVHSAYDSEGAENPTPPILDSDDPTLGAISPAVHNTKDKELQEANPALFRSGCIACHRPRNTTEVLYSSSCDVHLVTSQDQGREPRVVSQHSKKSRSNSSVMICLENLLPFQTTQPTAIMCPSHPSKGRKAKSVIRDENVDPFLPQSSARHRHFMQNTPLSSGGSQRTAALRIPETQNISHLERRSRSTLPRKSSLASSKSVPPTRRLSSISSSSPELIKSLPTDSRRSDSSSLRSSRPKVKISTSRLRDQAPVVVKKPPLDRPLSKGITRTRHMTSTLETIPGSPRLDQNLSSLTRTRVRVLGQRNVAE